MARSVSPPDGRSSNRAVCLGHDIDRGAPERQLDRRREHGASLRGNGRHLLLRDLRLVDGHREWRLHALEPAEGGDDDRGGSLLVELPALVAGHDLGLEPVQYEGGLPRGLVDVGRDLVEPVVERGLVDLHRRLDVSARDAQPQALEAAERNRPVAAPQRLVDRCGPVGTGLDVGWPQRERRPSRREGDRNGFVAPRRRLEPRLGLARQ